MSGARPSIATSTVLICLERENNPVDFAASVKWPAPRKEYSGLRLWVYRTPSKPGFRIGTSMRNGSQIGPQGLGTGAG